MVPRRRYLWFCFGRYLGFASLYAVFFLRGDIPTGAGKLPFVVACAGSFATCSVLLLAVVLGFAGRSPAVLTTVAWLCWGATLAAVVVTAATVGSHGLLFLSLILLPGVMPGLHLRALPSR
ncbi:hypothetical protein EBO15_37425 [Actinomadura harenae]|uniref:Uncharacterized protein n=1 Tax=Actinomadura harenae TaxID=2483351 RepID=A0A3M2LH82_9ACTN|nr:hypothetical protein EBO15_37425 [Actinomadura harenae]